MKHEFQKLLDGRLDHILIGGGRVPDPLLLYPGSFNPLHQGHASLLQTAEKITGRKGLFELSVKNVDKPALSWEEVEKRLSAFSRPAVLTSAPTFIEKAMLFPGAWFTMGYDTAIRLIDPKYHPDVPAMLEQFRALETKFAVAGRLHNGSFQSLEQIQIPGGFEELFLPIPEKLFRTDISSTELRSGD